MAEASPSSRESLLRLVLRVQERQNAADAPSPAKAKILATAMSLFTKTGFAGTSMRDIASDVGIKAASLYSHFPDGKTQILAVGLRSILDQFHAFVIEDIRYDLSAVDQLHAVLARHVRWQIDFGETAVAWDAAINQFGVAGALPDGVLEHIRDEQALYLDFIRALVIEVNAGRSSSEDVSSAVMLLCNSAHRFLPAELRSSAQVPTVQRDAVMATVWNLTRALLAIS